ncbi:MAG: hypothetical protein R2941_05090 [Desulfobacterales bacterium]
MCGIAGIVSLRQGEARDGKVDPGFFRESARQIREKGFAFCRDQHLSFEEQYLAGKEHLAQLESAAKSLKGDSPFYTVFSDKDVQSALWDISGQLSDFVEQEARSLKDQMGLMAAEDVDIMAVRIEKLRDIAWCIRQELCENVNKIRDLLYRIKVPSAVAVIFKRINTVLNSLDRLEVRGRDSAGISLLFVMDRPEYEALTDTLDKANFLEQFKERSTRDVLINMGISVRDSAAADGSPLTSIAFTYKVAAEIGKLGDNVAFLRSQIKKDPILQALVNFSRGIAPFRPIPDGHPWARSAKPTAIRWTAECWCQQTPPARTAHFPRVSQR